jgi:hypothetical protein
MCELDTDHAVTSSERRRARKLHVCCACGETIPVAALHVYTTQLYGGDWQHWRHCARCWLMVDAVISRGESCYWQLDCGASWEAAFGAAPPDDVAALAFLTPREAQQRLETTRV